MRSRYTNDVLAKRFEAALSISPNAGVFFLLALVARLRWTFISVTHTID